MHDSEESIESGQILNKG